MNRTRVRAAVMHELLNLPYAETQQGFLDVIDYASSKKSRATHGASRLVRWNLAARALLSLV